MLKSYNHLQIKLELGGEPFWVFPYGVASMQKGVLFFTIKLLVLPLSIPIFADVISPPSPFDGKCYCSIECSDVYVSNDPTNNSTVSGTYGVAYQIAPSTKVLADDGASLCKAAATVSSQGSALAITGIISPMDATIKLCKNGSPEIGYCATEASCRAEKVKCTSSMAE